MASGDFSRFESVLELRRSYLESQGIENPYHVLTDNERTDFMKRVREKYENSQEQRDLQDADVHKWKSKGKGCGASQPAAGCLKSFLKKQRRDRWFRHRQRVFGRGPTWQALAFAGRSDPDILRALQEAALPQNVDGQDAEGGTN